MTSSYNMDDLIYRGTTVKFKFNFDSPAEEVYILAEHHDDPEYVFQLICISGYNSGTIGGYIKIESKIENVRAVTSEHLKSELIRNFLNFELESFEILRQMEIEDFPKPLV